MSDSAEMKKASCFPVIGVKTESMANLFPIADTQRFEAGFSVTKVELTRPTFNDVRAEENIQATTTGYYIM
ncbi:hypothetical protein KIN20_001036 [Parelaphostrongylus tenuis]|uniref:Uncharacterized protein n=1 Tax=Parelaphostrongylus tenuis TaxID=148309 RepID=A0AAD5MC84_PARTN|nr:hypothetical protein KIN20_001036 [Parelaphostrongylus tenuis]